MSAPASRTSNYRQTEIVSLLRQSGRVGVEELATQFGVTLQTIRRDLNELSEAKLVVRVHGGAIIASGVANLAYEARQLVAHQHKRLIGAAAARLVPDNASLLINIGTTTEEVAKALVGHSGLLVITNNLHVANELHRNKSIEVIVTGGSIGRAMGALSARSRSRKSSNFASISRSLERRRSIPAAPCWTSTSAKSKYRAQSSNTRARSCWWPTAASFPDPPRCGSLISRKSTCSSLIGCLPRRSPKCASDATWRLSRQAGRSKPKRSNLQNKIVWQSRKVRFFRLLRYNCSL